MNQPIHLVQNYYAKIVDDKTIGEILKNNLKTMFPNTVDFNRYAVFSEHEIESMKAKKLNRKPPLRLSYVLEQEGNLVGWCTAYEKDIDEWYMHNSGIFKAHQKKGLYTAVLQLMIEYAKANGYPKISSTHNATNNAVIIPKLKAGFVISSLKINEKFGTMVELCYYVNPKIQAVINFRSGHRRLPQNLAEHINLFEDSKS